MDLRLFTEEVEKQDLKVEGIVVYQRGRELVRHRWEPEIRKTIYSIAKGFTSVAVGMAIDEGKLSLSDRVTSFFKREKSSGAGESARYSDERWDSLTLEHLLTMTMGHGAFTRPRSVDEALSYELIRDPGTGFLYDNTCSILASAMLTKATGFKLRDYLLDRLFRPLGIADPQWNEIDDGYTNGASHLFLTTSELALFGRFLLQRGNWEGKQLVSAAWIDKATRAHVPTWQASDQPDWDMGYGYQFWICRHGAFRNDGRDGQYVIVIPGLDAVIAISSARRHLEPILWAVWDFLLPQL